MNQISCPLQRYETVTDKVDWEYPFEKIKDE